MCQHNGVKRRFSDQDRTVTAVDTDEINVLKEKFEKATGQAASDGGINKQQARESPDNIKRKNDVYLFLSTKRLILLSFRSGSRRSGRIAATLP